MDKKSVENEYKICLTNLDNTIYADSSNQSNKIINTTPCPDQYIGKWSKLEGLTIKKVEERKTDEGINNIKYKYDDTSKTYLSSFPNDLNNNQKMVIILESPSKYEYRNGKGLGPLIGSQYKFKNHFNTFIKDSSIYKKLSGKYSLFFVNACQYQCNKGDSSQTEVRDENFQNIMNYNNNNIFVFRQDLFNRIAAIKPNVIINLCTGGINDYDNFKSEFDVKKDKVNDIPFNKLIYYIIKSLSDYSKIIYTYGTHPSYWNGKIV